MQNALKFLASRQKVKNDGRFIQRAEVTANKLDFQNKQQHWMCLLKTSIFAYKNVFSYFIETNKPRKT